MRRRSPFLSKWLLALLLLPAGISAAPKAEPRRPVVVVDPGHGGRDPGATVRPRVKEKEIAAAFAKRLASSLKKTGAVVHLTRERDRTLTLEQRNQFANRKQCDLFLSLHANSAKNRKASGTEIYLLNKASDEASRRLAERENSASTQPRQEVEAILSDLIQTASTEEAAELASLLQGTLQSRLKGEIGGVRVKSALFYVLVGAKCPSLLLEVGFLTNPSDLRKLRSAEYQRRWAEAVAEAVRRYWEKRGPVRNL